MELQGSAKGALTGQEEREDVMSDGMQHTNAQAPAPILSGGSRRKAGFALACLCALGLAALLGSSASTAGAAACPNEAIRKQQHATHLPDCRAYELVSAVDKNHSQVGQDALLSSTGERALYSLRGALPGGPSGGQTLVLATRSGDGWASKAMLPPRSQMLGTNYEMMAANRDLTKVVAGAGAGTLAATPDYSYVLLDDTGSQTALHTFPVFAGGGGNAPVASEGLDHVFNSTPYENDPSLPGSSGPGTANVYDFADEPPTLISVMPVSGLAPACGVLRPDSGNPGGFALDYVNQNWVSTDGSKVFFESSGDVCTDPAQLYRRDIAAGTTTLVSSPVVPGDPDHGVGNFLQGAADGSQAFYESATSFDPADDTDGNADDVDIYRWSQAGGNECITCSVPSVDIPPANHFPGSNAIISPDLSHVYFASEAMVAGAPEPGAPNAPNIYVWDEGQIDFVAPANGLAAGPVDGTEVTPDGNTLIFNSANPLLDGITGRSNGGFYQDYRYSDIDGSVICISCPADGVPVADVTEKLASSVQQVNTDVRGMSDDGETVVFQTRTALLQADVNQALDIYEWHNGEVFLITSGRTSYVGKPPQWVDTISPDGRDILFHDSALLTQDGQDSGSKIYDARIGGGFQPPPPQPVCSGDSCRVPPAPQSGVLPGGSDVLSGAANVKSAHRKHRKRRGRNRQHKSKAHKAHKAKTTNGRTSR